MLVHEIMQWAETKEDTFGVIVLNSKHSTTVWCCKDNRHINKNMNKFRKRRHENCTKISYNRQTRTSVLWDVMPSSLMKVNRHFEETCCLHLRHQRSRNQCESRWQTELLCLPSPLWEPQILNRQSTY